MARLTKANWTKDIYGKPVDWTEHMFLNGAELVLMLPFENYNDLSSATRQHRINEYYTILRRRSDRKRKAALAKIKRNLLK